MPSFRRPRGRRFRTVDRVNLSEHVLRLNPKKGSRQRFDFSEVEDYVRAITGEREYQFEAIRTVMNYLWGGGYKNLEELARENFEKNSHLKERFGSEELFLGHLPLPDRLSGVVHMATGTGKSFVVFAVAYLSIVMGLTKRVLVLGPSSTIIEEGLRDKFVDFMSRSDWNSLLPLGYQGKAVELMKDNDAIEDNSITIENINSIYREGGILDTLLKDTDEVLVLGDEIHHAYSHLSFNSAINELVTEQVAEGARESEENAERLWMQFLLGKGKYNKPDYFRTDGTHKITRHVGFTGTPYNANDYFADIIYDYNIRVGINERFIKDINPIIGIESDQGDVQWNADTRYAVIVKNHKDNEVKYAFEKNGIRRVKPITVFYCPTINNAKNKSEEFIRFLIKHEKEAIGTSLSDSELDQLMRDRVLCVVSGIADEEKRKLDNIEEIDPTKVGGKVEYIFSVAKLLEGWDVDNVFQIVPMEETAFNSKLKISQVLGRGLRIPRRLDPNNGYDLKQLTDTYPMLTVTNHVKFADQIKELVEAVTNSDMIITSEPLPVLEGEDWRGKYHFTLFNLSYLSGRKLEDAPKEPQLPQSRTLKLEKYDLKEGLTIYFDKDKKKYLINKNIVTVDFIVDELARRFRAREHEGIRFDFGNGEEARCPSEDEIRSTIITAMEEGGIPSNGLVAENKKQIDLYFNQFLPRGKKVPVPINILGDIKPLSTKSIDRSSLRIGELERDASAFLSEKYEEELDEKSKSLLKYLIDERTKRGVQGQQLSLIEDPGNLLRKYGENVKALVENDQKPPYVVKYDKLKSPQSTVLVNYYPEKEFVFRLIEHIEYIDSFVKSPDMGFYSIEYEYWKGGKDRVLRSFNPDFFIKIDLDRYIRLLRDNGKTENIEALKELQEKGIDTIIKIVEIKSDEDDDEATPAKAEKAKVHFEELNKKLEETNPIDVPEEFRSNLKQYYTFDLLKPKDYASWFTKLINGVV